MAKKGIISALSVMWEQPIDQLLPAHCMRKIHAQNVDWVISNNVCYWLPQHPSAYVHTVLSKGEIMTMNRYIIVKVWESYSEKHWWERHKQVSECSAVRASQRKEQLRPAGLEWTWKTVAQSRLPVNPLLHLALYYCSSHYFNSRLKKNQNKQKLQAVHPIQF